MEQTNVLYIFGKRMMPNISRRIAPSHMYKFKLNNEAKPIVLLESSQEVEMVV